MKSVMSLEMYRKLKLNDLNTSSIPHVVGARGRTKCKININRNIFYQTFIVCEHLKRPIILGRDFFDPKLHRNIMDKIKYPPINT